MNCSLIHAVIIFQIIVKVSYNHVYVYVCFSYLVILDSRLRLIYRTSYREANLVTKEETLVSYDVKLSCQSIRVIFLNLQRSEAEENGALLYLSQDRLYHYKLCQRGMKLLAYRSRVLGRGGAWPDVR